MSDYRSYKYDGKSQITRENNATTNKTTVWTYDTLGNITSKTIYPYTTGELGTAEQTVNYTYSNDGKTGWNYLLTGVGNDTITYDEIGNPTSYLGANLSWFGRKLQTYEKDGTSISYTYDANGMRAAKRVNGVKTEYLYLDGALRYEKRGADEYIYTYDANGYLANIKWYRPDDKPMINIYVITNAQGDVVGLYDYLGVIQVSYEYDAWGNTVSITDKTNGLWSGLNPFRYRGYYYDTDTGLYYLGSRYYNPEIGRFLNADGQISSGSIAGMNVYSYCDNNPVNRTDPNGDAWYHWAIGAAIVAGCAIATVITCGGFAAAATAVCMVSGGVAAATTASTIAAGAFIGTASVYGMAVASAAMTSTSISDFNDKGNWGVVATTAFGGIAGAANAYVSTRTPTTKVYRSVSDKEAQDIKNTGRFNLSPGGMESKQFGLDLAETRKFGNMVGQNAIVSAKVPTSMINQFYTGGVDTSIFQNGTITVYGEQLDMFNQAVSGTIKIIQ